MGKLPLLTSTILILLSSTQSKVLLPECPEDSVPKSRDLDSLDVKLKDGNGLFVESFLWYYSNDTQKQGHLSLEYLFNELIHVEFLPKSQDKKSVIVVNGTEHAFKAMLTSSKGSTTCEDNIMKTGDDVKWDPKSLHVLWDLVSVSEHISLSWILANLDKHSWVKKINSAQGLDSYVSCVDEDGSKIELTFLHNENPVFDNLIQVLVVPGKSKLDGYFLFDVFNVDKMEAKDTKPEMLQQSLGIFQPPEGMESCDNFMIREQPLISFPDQMSMSTELVDFKQKKIYYTSEFYDYTEKLVRIELHSGYTPGYVSPRHSRPEEDVHPVKYVRDLEYGLGFWLDMETGDCGIHEMHTNVDDISKEMWQNKVDITVDNVTSEAFRFQMTHPHEIYDFQDMHYTGRCLSQSYVTGLRYIHVKDDKLTEACFADGTWNINTLNSSANLPFYRKTFDLSQPREAPDFTPYLEKVTHFYDVEFHEPDASIFDISFCISDTSLTRHYILKTKASTKLLDPYSNNEPFSDEKQRSPLFKRMPRFISAMKASLQTKLQLPGVRIFDVFAEEPMSGEKETGEHSVVIGFGVLDFPADMRDTLRSSQELTDYRASGIYKSLQHINKTLYGFMTSDDGFVLNFDWVDFYRNKDGKIVNGTFTEKMRVENILEINEAAFESKFAKQKKIDAPPKNEGQGIGAGAVVAVAFCMTILGVGVGMALGWKLWKSGTSFGYTIHTNI